jgi:hypothetical protein
MRVCLCACACACACVCACARAHCRGRVGEIVGLATGLLRNSASGECVYDSRDGTGGGVVVVGGAAAGGGGGSGGAGAGADEQRARIVESIQSIHRLADARLVHDLALLRKK